MEKTDSRKFWLGAILALLGVAMLFVGMFIDPQGEVSGSVLGAVGEIFLLAGSLLGLDSYFNFKIKKFLKKDDGDSV
jgi:hypothetical protein